MTDSFGEAGRKRPPWRDISIRAAAGLLAAALAIGAMVMAAGCNDDRTPPPDGGNDSATMSCTNPQAPMAPCANGWDRYASTVCSPPDIDQGPSCNSTGDDRCYQECAHDGDCHDPCFPRCLSLLFGNGTDLVTYKSLCQPPPS